MADEMTTPSEEPASEPTADQTPPSPVEEANQFTSGEGMVAMAGILLLVVWLIFEVIAEEYGVPVLAVVLAIAAAVLPRVQRDKVESVHRLPVIMKVLGYSLAAIGLVEIIEELRDGILGADVFTILGALAAYGAYVMAFMGARSIKT